MTANWKASLATALCAAAFSQLGLAQSTPVTILQIDVENLVQYSEDTSDLSKFAATPNTTTPSAAKNFGLTVSIGDIVALMASLPKEL